MRNIFALHIYMLLVVGVGVWETGSNIFVLPMGILILLYGCASNGNIIIFVRLYLQWDRMSTR